METWYCCSCGDGPWNSRIHENCTACNDHQRCHQCSIEVEQATCKDSTSRGSKPSRANESSSIRHSQHIQHPARLQPSQNITNSHQLHHFSNDSSHVLLSDDHKEELGAGCSQNIGTDRDFHDTLASTDVRPDYLWCQDVDVPTSYEGREEAEGIGTASTWSRVRGVNRAHPAPSEPNIPNERVETSARKFTTYTGLHENIMCPFFKRNPFRYRHCQNYDLKDVSRVKDHLKRFHFLHQCYRCFKILPTKRDLNDHQDIQKNVECTRRTPNDRYPIEGVNEQMLESWKSKTGPSNRSIEKKWGDLWKVVFPNISDVPKCYFEDEDVLRSNSLQLKEESERELRNEHKLDMPLDVLRSRVQQYLRSVLQWSLAGLGPIGEHYLMKTKLSVSAPNEDAVQRKSRCQDNGERDLSEEHSLGPEEVSFDAAKVEASIYGQPFRDCAPLEVELGPANTSINYARYGPLDLEHFPMLTFSEGYQPQENPLCWELPFYDETETFVSPSFATHGAISMAPPDHGDWPPDIPVTERKEIDRALDAATFATRIDYEDSTLELADTNMDCEFARCSEIDLSQLLEDECNGRQWEH